MRRPDDGKPAGEIDFRFWLGQSLIPLYVVQIGPWSYSEFQTFGAEPDQEAEGP
jgi:hypothetical protein